MDGPQFEPGTGTKFVVGDVVKVLWGSGKKRGYYPAQIVDNKGGYKVQYLDDDGELIPDEIEENVVVGVTRRSARSRRSRRSLIRATTTRKMTTTSRARRRSMLFAEPQLV